MIKFIKMPKPHSSESGYTIMESLVAMIVVATLMSAIAPVIAISVGTRVQARRIELAAQAARSYIDGVRAGSIPAPGEIIGDEVELSVGTLSSCTPTDADDQPSYCDNPTVSLGIFYCIDVDGVDSDGDGKADGCTPDSLTDMMVHAAAIYDPDTQSPNYATQLANANSEEMSEIGYLLSVGVYRANAFKDAQKISTEPPTTSISNTGLATRSGDTERPLFRTTTEIAPSGENLFQKYRDRLN